MRYGHIVSVWAFSHISYTRVENDFKASNMSNLKKIKQRLNKGNAQASLILGDKGVTPTPA